ncbi:hypothetical protein, partial [Klebsiella pneumoniae]|uniref:hypothetical protein n=1 Tax=Klebsiella pneumoniae TaxID=573 RepID=UPI0019D301E1
QTETEATGAPQKHHYTLNQQVGSITTLLVESDKYMARYRFTLEPRVTENVLMKYMIFGCFEEFGRDEGLRRLRDILLTCFTDDGDINEMGLQIVKSCHLEYLHEDLGADMSNKVLH